MTEPIHLDLGEPGYSPPERAVSLAVEAALNGEVGYTAPGGLPELRAAAAAYVRAEHDVVAEADDIVVTTGASTGLLAAMASILSSGDQVLVPDPGYPAYRQIARTLGLEVATYALRAERGFAPDLDDVARRVGPRTRALIVNSPANPTGTIVDEDLMAALVELAHRRGIYVISDEAYASIVFEGRHVSPARRDGHEHTLAVYSFSKSFALSGWRIGFVVAPRALASAVERAQWASAMSAPTLGQVAALACLAEPHEYRQSVVETLRSNRALAVDILAAAGIPVPAPRGGFFLWIHLPEGEHDARQVAERLWQEERVAVVPGSVFGDNGADRIRVQFAARRELVEEGFSRLARFYARWASPGSCGREVQSCAS